jgi:hypothetical protein
MVVDGSVQWQCPEAKGNDMDKPRFPLSLIPAPRGWHMLITGPTGQTDRLFKPARRDEPEIPCLFVSQQEAWTFVKERFSLILLSHKPLETFQTEKMRNCKQCDRIFKATNLDFCPHCMKDNQLILQQLWQGFQQEEDPEYTDLQKITAILSCSLEDFANIPELFKSQVQQQLALEEQLENEAPSPARQLSRIIRSRANSPKRRRVR